MEALADLDGNAGHLVEITAVATDDAEGGDAVGPQPHRHRVDQVAG